MPYFIIQGPKPLTAGVTYLGPGDVTTNAHAWWGLRGYNAAYCGGGSPAMDVVDSNTGIITTTINIRTDGSLDVAAIAALGTGQSVTKLYDQTGNGNHLVQTTLARMPTISLNTLGALTTLPAMVFLAASSTRMVTVSNFSQPQPFSTSIVARRNGSFTSFGGLIEDFDNLTFQYSFGSATNVVTMFNGSAVPVACSNSVLHALQFVANGASPSSLLQVDGSLFLPSPGSGGCSGRLAIGDRSATTFLDGYWQEGGIWNSAWDSIQATSMQTNEKAYWNTP